MRTDFESVQWTRAVTGYLLGGLLGAFTFSSPATAQIDVRFTEVPNYSSEACARGVGRSLNYEKPSSQSAAGYRALFGVWCAVNQSDQNEFLIAISEDDTPYEGQKAQTVKLTFKTDGGLRESFGVAFFDTRQQRWAMTMGQGDTWVMWSEGRDRLGQGRGRVSGNTARMQKGRQQTWVLLRRVR